MTVAREVLNKLAGGDRRSMRSDEVVADVLRDPAVFGGMLDEDPLIRMRSADAVEKVTAEHPEYLRPHKERIVRQVANIGQQEVRRHVAQMLPRLGLSREEREVASSILLDYLDDGSKIVQTCSMQALADLAEEDAGLRPRVIRPLEDSTEIGSPAAKSRGRKLPGRLDGRDERPGI